MKWNSENIAVTKSCSVFGHRKIEITEKLRGKVNEVMEELIVSQGVDTFFFGGFGEFDDLCYEIVTELKKKYTHIQRVFCVADKRWLRLSKRPTWLNNEAYEDIVYLDMQFDWWYTRIYYRNCEIIKNSDYVVFYVTNTESSGAYKAMQFAKKAKKKITNVADML